MLGLQLVTCGLLSQAVLCEQIHVGQILCRTHFSSYFLSLGMHSSASLMILEFCLSIYLSAIFSNNKIGSSEIFWSILNVIYLDVMKAHSLINSLLRSLAGTNQFLALWWCFC